MSAAVGGGRVMTLLAACIATAAGWSFTILEREREGKREGGGEGERERYSKITHIIEQTTCIRTHTTKG